MRLCKVELSSHKKIKYTSDPTCEIHSMYVADFRKYLEIRPE